jgi:hypothetical protein
VRQYLERREIAEARRGEVENAAQGNWLVVRMLADVLSERPDAEIRAGQLALDDAYEEMLSRCGATGDDATQRILAVLAAAGAGPLLPLSLLCTASNILGGPATPAGVRDQLVRRPEPLVNDGLEAKRGPERQKQWKRLRHAMRRFVSDHRAERMPDQRLGFRANQLEHRPEGCRAYSFFGQIPRHLGKRAIDEPFSETHSIRGEPRDLGEAYDGAADIFSSALFRTHLISDVIQLASAGLTGLLLRGPLGDVPQPLYGQG